LRKKKREREKRSVGELRAVRRELGEMGGTCALGEKRNEGKRKASVHSRELGTNFKGPEGRKKWTKLGMPAYVPCCQGEEFRGGKWGSTGWHGGPKGNSSLDGQETKNQKRRKGVNQKKHVEKEIKRAGPGREKYGKGGSEGSGKKKDKLLC